MRIRFEWDSVKATFNQRKHGISFDIAIRAFADPFALTDQDRIAGGEFRWRTLGTVDGHLVLLVAHALWDQDDEEGPIEVVRIISARRADRAERKRYENEHR